MKTVMLAIAIAIFSYAPGTPAEQYPEVTIKAQPAVYVIDIDPEATAPVPVTIQI